MVLFSKLGVSKVKGESKYFAMQNIKNTAKCDSLRYQNVHFPQMFLKTVNYSGKIYLKSTYLQLLISYNPRILILIEKGN